jgi:hypothetical protein
MKWIENDQRLIKLAMLAGGMYEEFYLNVKITDFTQYL